ncbi:hypothetical protein Tco_0588335, partial [Tanacetum coccineum]
MHMLLNPSQREELENELTSREELAVLQVEFADIEVQMHQLKEELKKSQKIAFFWKSTAIVFRVVASFMTDPAIGGSVGRMAQLFGTAFEFHSLNRSMHSDKYLEGQSMQRPPLFESDHWKRISDKRTKNKAKNDKTRRGVEKRGKAKVKSKP